MLPQEVIRRKRDGAELHREEIELFVRGIASGSIVDAQVGAFAMAVLWRGMTAAETVALTLAMRDSGTVLSWPDLAGPVVDKHSTGGIGDKVSLVLAPLLAACGCNVPMLSGRGLGHTGGTLDKLESIPGYDVRPDVERLRHVLATAGCAIVGQTDDLAPADRRLYAIRDVTATVESIPLITASILSKKLAASPQALVMDVKTGSGAFLPETEQARALASSIVTVARGAGLACSAILSDMGQCLGRTAGNAVEVGEALAMLRGDAVEPRLREVTLVLAGEALRLVGLVEAEEEGRVMAERALASGAAAERFAAMSAALGGPADIVEHPTRHLPRAPRTRGVIPARAGYVRKIDVRRLGLAIVELGGGRIRPDSAVDHRVGLTDVRGIGEWCAIDEPLSVIRARDDHGLDAAAATIRHAFELGDEPVPAVPVVVGRM